jgi:hypothetical protein
LTRIAARMSQVAAFDPARWPAAFLRLSQGLAWRTF